LMAKNDCCRFYWHLMAVWGCNQGTLDVAGSKEVWTYAEVTPANQIVVPGNQPKHQNHTFVRLGKNLLKGCHSSNSHHEVIKTKLFRLKFNTLETLQL
jgi:hypothetical protein